MIYCKCEYVFAREQECVPADVATHFSLAVVCAFYVFTDVRVRVYSCSDESTPSNFLSLLFVGGEGAQNAFPNFSPLFF